MTELADRCPQCVPQEPTLPRKVWAAGDARAGIRADYRCKTCGHEWYTTWLITAAERTEWVA